MVTMQYLTSCQVSFRQQDTQVWVMEKIKINEKLIQYSRSELIADDGGVVCGRSCNPTDVNCHYNKTKTVSWQFLALPQVEFVHKPLTLLNIRTIGYSIYPNLDLRIISGNEDGKFQTVVEGDQAFLKLLKPLFGPAEYEVTMKLENRDFSRTQVISRHITHAKIFVSDFPQ